jgi:sugar lactone lactonase YvrE
MTAGNRAPALFLALAALIASPIANAADQVKQIALPGDRAYPESIAAASDGTLYISSIASGGIWRIKPGAAKTEQWIAPGAFDTRSTLGVLVDEKKGLLWVCSNDMSAAGVPGPGSAPGSNLKAFDLVSGEGKISVAFPGTGNICNDMAVAADGSVFVTNSLKPQILRLKPGAASLEVFVESATFNQPKEGANLDGIAFGGDGNLYVNTYANGEFFRVEVKDGNAGAVMKLATSRALKLPDGLRPTGGLSFVMAEGGGTIDRVRVTGQTLQVETVRDGLAGPTGVALVGDTLWAPEGQLSHLFDAKAGPPNLPFRIVGVPATAQ